MMISTEPISISVGTIVKTATPSRKPIAAVPFSRSRITLPVSRRA